MYVNNETGNIYPVSEVAQICSRYNTLLFCDATQAIGKIPLTMSLLPDTLIAFSGHKFYAPKGVGALVTDKSIPVRPLLVVANREACAREQ